MSTGSVSRFTIESLALDPCAAHVASFFRNRCLARTIGGGLSPEEHAASALALDFPPSDSAKLHADVEQAVSFVSGSSAEWGTFVLENAHKELGKRGAEPVDGRRDELLRADPAV